jgi:hypothetical protein
MLNKIEQIQQYSTALLLSTAKQKSFEALAAERGISGDKMADLVTDKTLGIDDLIAVAKKEFGNKKAYLIIDDTLISKQYSRVIEGTSDNYDSSENRTYRSLCVVVGMLTDGTITIPINHAIWVSKEFAEENSYKKKRVLAQELILQIKDKINIKCVIMDGLYAVDEFMKWLTDQKISFEMRMHSNRVVEQKSICAQLRHHPGLALKRGRSSRTIKVLWKGNYYYVTAYKRYDSKENATIVFQVSNFKAIASQHIRIYGYRWNIEIFFRTAKQSLGLKDCQSRKLARQEGHIFQVFLAYTIAQCERKILNLKNTETAIKSIKARNSINRTHVKSRFIQIFCPA